MNAYRMNAYYMSAFYWTIDTFGSGELPENWEDLCASEKEAIDAFAAAHHLDPLDDADREELQNYSERLFGEWVVYGNYPGPDPVYYVIGGQYGSYCYGYSKSLHGAKLLAAKHDEYWDNWQGWHRPAVYRSSDCFLAKTQFYGEQMIPFNCAAPVAMYDMERKRWFTPADVSACS